MRLQEICAAWLKTIEMILIMREMSGVILTLKFNKEKFKPAATDRACKFQWEVRENVLRPLSPFEAYLTINIYSNAIIIYSMLCNTANSE